MSGMVRILAAGRAALVDSGNTGTNAVEITRVALGAGLAPADADDDARTALRNEQDEAAATGAAAAAGDLAVRADIAPTASYSVTEMGLFARIGSGGDEFLFGYWAVSDAASAMAAAVANGATITVAAVIRVAGSAADVEVAPSLDLTIAAVRAASEEQAGILKLATEALADAGDDDETAMTPAMTRRVTGVRNLSVTRPADVAGLTQNTELGSLTITRTGVWLFQAVVALSSGGLRSVTLDGQQFVFRGGGQYYPGSAVAVKAIEKNAGDTVTLNARGYTGFDYTFRFLEITFEAFYLGPST